MAVNGLSECFTFAVLSRPEVESYNYTLALLTAVFLGLAWILSNILGPIGFIMANCVNFAFRIAFNFRMINQRYLDVYQAHLDSKNVKELSNPISSFIPSKKVLFVLFISAVSCHFSEVLLYEPSVLKAILIHLFVGAACGLLTLSMIVIDEPLLKNFIINIVYRKTKKE